jgi:Bacterial Ig-like domain
MPIRFAILAAAMTLTLPAFGLELQSLRFTPTDIDTGPSAAQVAIHFTVADEGSEVTYFEASFVDPSGISRLSASAKLAPSPTVIGSVEIVFPQFTNSGTWTLSTVFVSDSAGKTLLLDTAELNRRGFVTRLEVQSPKDRASPKLTALDFVPARIDTTDRSADVHVAYTAIDDLSGVSHIELAFRSPSRTVMLRGSATIEAARQVSNSILVNFPRLSEPGQWTLAFVFLSDAAGNTLYLNSEGIMSYGFRSTLEVKSRIDTASPRLTALSFVPDGIDTSRSPAVVRVDYNATDDLSGLASIEAAFVSPSGTVWQRGSATLSPTTSASGSVDVKFRQATEGGRWTLSTVLLADAAGNTLSLDKDLIAQLGFRTALEVKSTPDTNRPVLTALTFAPEAIDTGTGPAKVRVRFTAADDLSGVRTVEVAFTSPSGYVRRTGSAVFPPATSVTNSIEVEFPYWSEPGRWVLSSVLVSDAAGNTTILDEQAVAANGFRTILHVAAAN